MAEDKFDPSGTAAKTTKSPDPKKEVKPNKHLAASAHIKTKAAPQATVTPSSTGFPPPGDPYWKQHPIETEHQDGTIRKWGEDTTIHNNPNILPKQILPPPVPIKQSKYSDSFEPSVGKGGGSMAHHQD